ncbi:MAG: hypothetical protein IPL49_08095 [Saprospirales bacterium]|nr:hypothetical protein [Saprospirales bacterium]
MEEAAEVLRTHHPVLILAEGATIHEKRLRPLQKGTARIALGTEDQHPNLGIQLVPVGVNYTYADRFRSEAMIHFGEPIPVRNFLESYRDNASNGLRDLTEALRVGLEQIVVIIQEEGDEAWVDQLLQIYRNNQADSFGPQTVYDGSRLSAEKSITVQVNGLREPDSTRWKGVVEHYSRELKRYRSTDKGLMAGGSTPWVSGIVLLGGAPFFLLTFLLHGLPLWIAGKIGYGRRVPRREFKASVALVTALLLYILWILLYLYLEPFCGAGWPDWWGSCSAWEREVGLGCGICIIWANGKPF